MAEAIVLQHVCKLLFEIGLPYYFFELHWGKDKDGEIAGKAVGRFLFSLLEEMQSLQGNIFLFFSLNCGVFKNSREGGKTFFMFPSFRLLG